MAGARKEVAASERKSQVVRADVLLVEDSPKHAACMFMLGGRR